MSLFQHGSFVGASGKTLDWKIECDHLTPDDWDCVAKICVPRIGSFRYLFGVPKGGYPLVKAFAPYIDWKSDITLIVDDVWTTGKSLYNYVNYVVFTEEWKGFAAFARGPYPKHRITTFMELATINNEDSNVAPVL